ncbi:hypothetical protein HPP92_010882 [Vanilla planifolia]|uniref:Pectinesterase inhibitor domain-containing protein n=1 Tax=Vanilla planifolia TaxID=51239 RepID=A0A835UXY5_VANPL|nr:hypothetical protein HPP92_010882 [Vanilla planifolia]
MIRNFNGNGVISSMQQCNDFFFLGTEQVSMGRVGDDFWFQDPNGDPMGVYWLQGVHMIHCSYNSLWMGQMIRPDWDMFQSDHVCAKFHAGSRAICGGPVYLSDGLGGHNFDLIKKLVFPDGTIPSVLKIWNFNKFGGVLGAFNCQGAGWDPKARRIKGFPDCYKPISGTFHVKDIEWDQNEEAAAMGKASESSHVNGVDVGFEWLEKKKMMLKVSWMEGRGKDEDIPPHPLIFLVLSSSLLRFSTAAFAPRGSPISFLTTSLPPASAPQSSSLITAPTSPGLLATTLFTDSKATFPVSSVDNALKSLCGHTDFTDLCVDAIKETSPGLTRADNVTVLVTLMLAVEAKAREAKAYALQLAHSSAYDPKSRELLHDCADLIDDALDNLAAAAAAVKAHDDGTRDAVLSAMISNFGDMRGRIPGAFHGVPHGDLVQEASEHDG